MLSGRDDRRYSIESKNSEEDELNEKDDSGVESATTITLLIKDAFKKAELTFPQILNEEVIYNYINKEEWWN